MKLFIFVVLIFLTACSITQDYRTISKVSDPQRLTLSFTGTVIDAVDYYGQKSCHKSEGGQFTGLAQSQENPLDPQSQEYQELCDQWGGQIDQQKITAVQVLVDQLTLLESECTKDFTLNKQVTLLYEDPKLVLKNNDKIGGLFTARYKVEQGGQNYRDYIAGVIPDNFEFSAEGTNPSIPGTPIFKSEIGEVLQRFSVWITGIELDPKTQANSICQKESQRLVDFYKNNQVTK